MQNKQISKKMLYVGFFCITFILSFSYWYEKLPVRIDLSMDKSLPYSVWLTENKFDIEKHRFVMFKPTVSNQYTAKVKYFIKAIGCKQREELFVSESQDYYCNKKFIGHAMSTDINGKRVDNFIFNGVVPNGYVFAIGTHKRSYDSKYYGFVPIASIERGVTPIW